MPRGWMRVWPVADRRGDVADGGFEQGQGVAALLMRVDPGDGGDVHPPHLVPQPPAGHVDIDGLFGQDRVDRLDLTGRALRQPVFALAGVEVLRPGTSPRPCRRTSRLNTSQSPGSAPRRRPRGWPGPRRGGAPSQRGRAGSSAAMPTPVCRVSRRLALRRAAEPRVTASAGSAPDCSTLAKPRIVASLLARLVSRPLRCRRDRASAR